jgi:hypothetical protein
MAVRRQGGRSSERGRTAPGGRKDTFIRERAHCARWKERHVHTDERNAKILKETINLRKMCLTWNIVYREEGHLTPLAKTRRLANTAENCVNFCDICGPDSGTADH